MAQVKKLEGGGTPSKKYFMFNGTKIVEGDDNFKQLEQYALNGNRFAQRILETLPKSNNDIVVNTSSDGVDFKNLDMDYYNERTGKQFEKGDNLWRRTFRTKEGKNYIEDAIKLKFAPSSINKTDEDDLIDISTGSRRFSYDKDGKYDQYLQSNANFLKTLDQITDYFTLGREAGDKKYKFSGEGLDMDAMWSIYNNPNSPIDLADFRRRILAGDVDDSDPVYRFLDPFFQGKGSAVTEDGQQVIADQKQADAWKEWSKRGFGNAADTKNFTYDSNSGKWVLNPGVLTSLGLTANSGAWFNDNFIRNHYGYDFLKDKVLLNGNWYTTKDLTDPNSEAYKYLNSAQNDYYNKNRRGETDAADAVMMTSWGDKYESVYDPSLIGDLYNDKNIRVLKTNLATDNTTYDGIKLDPEYQVIKYINMQDQDLTGLGQRPVKYRIYDQYGNKVDIHDPNEESDGPRLYDYDVNKFSGLYDYSTNKEDQYLSAYSRVSQDKDNPYYNAYELPPIKDADGNELIKAWKVMGQGQHVAISPKFGGSDGFAFENMPDDVYAMLTDSNFLNSILSDRQLADSFTSLVNGTGKDENFWSFDWAQGKKGRGKEIIAKLTDYFGEDNAEKFVNYFLHSVRNSDYSIAQPKIYKAGGVIKKQPGGRFEHVGVKKQITDKVVKLSQKAKGPVESKELDSLKDLSPFSDWSKNLSATDKKELNAIMIDLASSIAGYTGVGDVASIGGGLISNIMRADVDRRRVNAGEYEKGTAFKNFVGRTALDLASVIPIVGDTMNTGKAFKDFASFLKRNEKWTRGLSAAFLGAGLASSAESIDKFIRGEKLTIDDVQSIATGLQSITGLGLRGLRRAQDANLASKIQNKSGEIKYSKKIGDKDIVLDDGDIRKITQTSGKEGIDKEFKNILKNKYNLSEDEIKNLTPEDFGFVYKGRKWWGKDSVSTKKQEKTKGAFRYFLPNSGLRDDLKNNIGNLSNLDYKVMNNSGAVNRLVRQHGLPDSIRDDYTITGLNKNRFKSILNPYARTELTPNSWRGFVPTMHPSLSTDVDAPISLGSHLNVGLNSLPRTNALANRAKIASFKGKKLMEPTLTSPYGKYYDDVIIMEKQGGILKAQFGARLSLGYTIPTLKPVGTTWHPSLGQRPIAADTKVDFHQYTKYPNTKQPSLTPETDKIVNQTTQKLNEFNRFVNSASDKLRIAGITPANTGTTGKTTNVDNGNGRLSHLPKLDNIDAIELGKYLNAKNVSKDNEGLYKDIAEITARNQLPLLQDRNRRFILPQYDAARTQIADARLQSKLHNSMFADAKVATAGWLGSEKNIMDTNAGYNKTISDNITDQNRAHEEQQFKTNLANHDIIAHNNNATTSGAIAGKNAELYRNAVESDLANKFGMYWQSQIHNQNKADFVADEQARYYDKLAASTTNNPTLKQTYTNFATELRTDDYKNRLAKGYYYGLKAKQGGKLRSTSDQMLTDNQKNVAKAIEKLNDNTMKLILKALS